MDPKKNDKTKKDDTAPEPEPTETEVDDTENDDPGEELTDEDAEAAFDEGAGVADEKAPAATDPDDPGETPAESDDHGKKPVEKSGEKPVQPGSDDPAKSGDPAKPSYDAIEKALADTQSWATRLAQENAALKTSAPKKDAAPVEKNQIPATDDTPKEIKEFYEDYPQFQKAVEFEAQKLIKQQFGNFDPTSVSAVQSKLDQADFEKRVVTGFVDPTSGQWVDGHPDAYKVMNTPDFQAWFNAELQKNPNAATVSDPKAAIDVLNRFKTTKASTAAAAHDDTAKTTARQMTDFASGGAAPGTNPGAVPRKQDESPEEIFDKHAT